MNAVKDHLVNMEVLVSIPQAHTAAIVLWDSEVDDVKLTSMSVSQVHVKMKELALMKEAASDAYACLATQASDVRLMLTSVAPTPAKMVVFVRISSMGTSVLA